MSKHICDFENEDSGYHCNSNAWTTLIYTDERGNELIGDYCDAHAEELRAEGWKEE